MKLRSLLTAVAALLFALVAQPVCAATVTIAVSVVTAPKPDPQLVGLVYGLTPQPSEEGLAWYQRPAPLALCVLLLTAAVNVIFW